MALHARKVSTAAAFAVLLVAAPRPAAALQPLAEFLVSGRRAATESREAAANRRAADAQADAARGRLLPGFSARGTYTRNEYETVITIPTGGGPPQAITVTPGTALEATAAISVPLLDLAAWARSSAAGSRSRASREIEQATGLQVEANVAQSFYQLVASAGIAEAAARALEVARKALVLAEERRQAGTVPSIDVDRARAEVERQVQLLAAAELDVELARRALESASGLTPESGPVAAVSDDLHEEPPLATFQSDGAPAVVAAALARRAQEEQARSQRLQLVPALTGSVTERATNAPGLSTHDVYWLASLNVTWALDFATVPSIRAEDALAAAAAAREDRTRIAARDAVHRNWNVVNTGIARSRSARVQAEVSARASEFAAVRYEAGSGTQLDLLQAQRDAFSAEAARIQADANLINARAQLRLAAGGSILSAVEGTP